MVSLVLPKARVIGFFNFSKMYLFAATTHSPKETGGKQDFPTGFQLWKSLGFLGNLRPMAPA